VLVVDEQQRLTGIFTGRDAVRAPQECRDRHPRACHDAHPGYPHSR
jgi:hypothetical protein